EGGKAAFIFAELGRIGPVRPGEPRNDHRQHNEARGQAEGDDQEQQDRQVAGGDACQEKLRGSKTARALGQRVAGGNSSTGGNSPPSWRLLLLFVRRRLKA